MPTSFWMTYQAPNIKLKSARIEPVIDIANRGRELNPISPLRPIFNEPVSRLYFPLPADDPLRRRPDITRAKTWLNWGPTISLQTGLKMTVEDFYSHIHAND